MRCLGAVVVVFLIAGSVFGQSSGDTARADTTVIDTVLSDTLKLDSLVAPIIRDSLGLLSIEDSILFVYPRIDLDTLNERQRKLVEFEARFALRQMEISTVDVVPVISYQDSLVSWLVTDRWNLREEIDRSFYHDAGDYFKFNTAFFTLDNQATPLRKTVQPYGLRGDRLGFIVGDRNLNPFEHVLEPDGLTDLNDIPTALDDRVAILPGPMGMVLGGDHAVATLLTRPEAPESTTPESEFLVDKGSFGYAFTRGRYSKDFANGREIDASIGYRRADGLAIGRSDDAYHYSGAVLWPLDATKSISASGWLYDRTGFLQIRPDDAGRTVERNRFDRYGQVAFVHQNEEQTAKYEVGFRHQRQSSNYDGLYRSRDNMTANDMLAAREWLWGGGMVKTEFGGGYDEYDDRFTTHTRGRGRAALSYARRAAPIVYALSIRSEYVDDYRFLPSVSAVVTRDSGNRYWMVSAGYSERAPSLYELHLRYQEAAMYKGGSRYADEGNSGLQSEKLLTGAARFELGSAGTSVGLSATGGKILDGIDWVHTAQGNLTTFRPVNGDVGFADVTANARLSISDFLRFHGGGSYHYVDYADFEDAPYSPDYQVFSGLELHLFWTTKRIDFWGYGEIVYTGEYDGYVETGLGQEPVINIKLSAKMGAFRFHWISQNVLSNPYSAREYSELPGRFNSYGFTWFFLD